MANLTSKVLSFKIDDSTGSLATISGNVNQQSLRSAITILDDTAIGDSQHTTLYGLGAAQVVSINGWVNTTVDAIFGAITNGTSVAKTVVFGANTARFYTGEMLVQDYEVSGSVDALQTFSSTLVAQAGLTRTSVSPA